MPAVARVMLWGKDFEFDSFVLRLLDYVCVWVFLHGARPDGTASCSFLFLDLAVTVRW